jgi:hypothetical protein
VGMCLFLVERNQWRAREPHRPQSARHRLRNVQFVRGVAAGTARGDHAGR